MIICTKFYEFDVTLIFTDLKMNTMAFTHSQA